MFKRVLIANRGEIALRIIRACRAMGIEAVAVYSEADADSPHLKEADETVCIGAARSGDSYLNMAAILQAAEQTEAKAIHPGYGFLSENALFAELAQQMKFAWIGPPPRAIRLMGDKATARRTMKAAGLPVIPGSEGVVADLEDARASARRIGFPVILKATAGGGGKGMRVCRDEADLAESFAPAAAEAGKAFGSAGLYLEKFIEGGRHIEFQFMADAFGHVVHLGERECSVQRNHQKLVEESPSPAIDFETRARIGALVCEGMRSIEYVGAGTVEFLRDRDGRLYFIEVNTRLQVEHPGTEMVTGLDLVQQQIRVAANEALTWRQEEVAHHGHAIECRINAEDPYAGFRPSPGLVEVFDPPRDVPAGARLRLDTHVKPGYRIPMYYDSMICKLIVHGQSRPCAIEATLAALQQFRVEGIKTTIGVHQQILQHPDFVSGHYDTGLIARMLG